MVKTRGKTKDEDWVRVVNIPARALENLGKDVESERDRLSLSQLSRTNRTVLKTANTYPVRQLTTSYGLRTS